VAQGLIRQFMGELTERIDLPEPIVEFGALQVEADQDCDLRPLFAGRHFTGTDMREGKGVDRVEDLRSLSFADGEVGTAICLDTLEHCEDPAAACRELHRVVGDGGVCVISSVFLFPVHAYPNDYFRFTPEAFRSLLTGFDDVWVAGVGLPEMPVQVIGVGAKNQSLDLSVDAFPSLMYAQREWDEPTDHLRVGLFMLPANAVVRELLKQSPRLVRERIRRRAR
jgi:SAM-dependent methyltransferase